MYLDICYEQNAPPDAIKFIIIQNKKQLVPLSSESTTYTQATDFGYLPPNGEQIVLEFASEKIESTALTVLIETPEGQHGETELDLQRIR